MEEDYVYQYYDPKTLLLVNQKGVIKTLHVPFRVECVEKAEGMTEGVIVYVEEVHTNEKAELFFLVFGRTYLHSHFRLLL